MKPRGLPPSGSFTRNTSIGSELSLLPPHRSTPTETRPGVSDECKYGSQVSTRPNSDFAHCETVGLDRDSEVTLLGPASPQADLPNGTSGAGHLPKGYQISKPRGKICLQICKSVQSCLVTDNADQTSS